MFIICRITIPTLFSRRPNTKYVSSIPNFNGSEGRTFESATSHDALLSLAFSPAIQCAFDEHGGSSASGHVSSFKFSATVFPPVPPTFPCVVLCVE
ncbi:hypothetical protein DIPPA_13288 [Diplonema papillatum]|nr:hypothetical protein DIPPA_13288 [Diplonema papillatum]